MQAWDSAKVKKEGDPQNGKAGCVRRVIGQGEGKPALVTVKLDDVEELQTFEETDLERLG